MTQIADTAKRLKSYWVLGFLVLLGVIGSAVLAGLIAMLILSPLQYFLGWDDRALETWLGITAVIWLPIAVGHGANRGLRTLPRIPLINWTDRQRSS